MLVPSFVLNFERISFFINFREYSFKWLMWIRGIVYNARVHTKDVNLCKLYFVRESCQQHTYGGHNRGGCYRIRYSIGVYKKKLQGSVNVLKWIFSCLSGHCFVFLVYSCALRMPFAPPSIFLKKIFSKDHLVGKSVKSASTSYQKTWSTYLLVIF